MKNINSKYGKKNMNNQHFTLKLNLDKSLKPFAIWKKKNQNW